MAVIVAAKWRAHVKKERIFSTCSNVFKTQEEDIIKAYQLPRHVVLNLLEEIKNDLEPK